MTEPDDLLKPDDLLYRNARADEKFFYSRWCPRVFVHVNLILASITVWGPWPFITVTAGWLLTRGRKAHPIQTYVGIKCDGSRTRDCNPWAVVNGQFLEDRITRWVMVLTPKEWVALRRREVNFNKEWNNEAG